MNLCYPSLAQTQFRLSAYVAEQSSPPELQTESAAGVDFAQRVAKLKDKEGKVMRHHEDKAVMFVFVVIVVGIIWGLM